MASSSWEILFLLTLIVHLFPSCCAIINGWIAFNSIAGRSTVIIEMETGETRTFGAGALLSRRFVLTSGIVCERVTPNTGVYIGEYRLFRNLHTLFFVNQSKIFGEGHHAAFRLCLLQLDRDKLADDDTIFAFLPDHGDDIRTNIEHLYASGYGSEWLNQTAKVPDNIRYHLSDEQRILRMPITHFTFCQSYYKRVPNLNSRFFLCVGNVEKNQRMMPGDLGAPVVNDIDGKVYGIMVDPYSVDDVVWSPWEMPLLHYMIRVDAYKSLILKTMAEMLN